MEVSEIRCFPCNGDFYSLPLIANQDMGSGAAGLCNVYIGFRSRPHETWPLHGSSLDHRGAEVSLKRTVLA